MAETAFDVIYDGPALADGRMPVRNLAPALLALADLFAEASAVVYPDREPVALNIQATKDGSFMIELILHAGDAWNAVRDFFTSDTAEALVNFKDLIIGGGVGLFAFIRWLRGRRIESQEPLDAGRIRLTLTDGTTIDIPAEVLSLYQNLEIRRKAREVVQPLTEPGVERLEFRAESATVVGLTANDVEAFAISDEDEPLLRQDVELVVSIASVAFLEGNKWRFTDGDNTFYATIEDKTFLERVEHGIESFRKGDMLRCRMRIVQSRRAGALHTDYYVVEVIEHLPRGIQLRLREPDSPPDETDS